MHYSVHAVFGHGGIRITGIASADNGYLYLDKLQSQDVFPSANTPTTTLCIQ